VFDLARIGFVNLGSDGMETRSKERTGTVLTGLDVFVIDTLRGPKSTQNFGRFCLGFLEIGGRKVNAQ
jgi:hypothetical protein